MKWEDILKNIQISGQRTSSRDYVNVDDEEDCIYWFKDLYDICEKLSNSFEKILDDRTILKFPQLTNQEYCSYRDKILSDEGYKTLWGVNFSDSKFMHYNRTFLFRFSLTVYDDNPTKTPTGIGRFNLYLNDKFYMKLRFKINDLVNADKNMFDILDNHVNANGLISGHWQSKISDREERI